MFFFAVEVGARGYGAVSLLSCLRCLFNKGNTCYVNVILQALRPLSSLWSDSSTPSQTSSALGLAFRRLMANMGCAKTCIDPSTFLFTIENFIRRSGISSFVVNSPQDAAEMLEHVLNELMGDSVVAGSTTAIKNRISISYNSCFNSLQTEDIMLCSPANSLF